MTQMRTQFFLVVISAAALFFPTRLFAASGPAGGLRPLG